MQPCRGQGAPFQPHSWYRDIEGGGMWIVVTRKGTSIACGKGAVEQGAAIEKVLGGIGRFERGVASKSAGRKSSRSSKSHSDQYYNSMVFNVHNTHSVYTSHPDIDSAPNHPQQ